MPEDTLSLELSKKLTTQSTKEEEEEVGKSAADGPPSSKPTSRAARRRERRAAERRAQEQAATKLADPSAFSTSSRSLELRKIEQHLALRNLRIHQVPSDGDCLYLSIAHQLRLHRIPIDRAEDLLHASQSPAVMSNGESHEGTDVHRLRRLTAQHLRANMDEFLPFMLHPETGEPMTTDAFHAYCDAVEKTSAWGGQIEVRALSNVLRIPIEVLQAEGQPVLIGEEFGGSPITIVYHRHAFALGEHYNSCVPV